MKLQIFLALQIAWLDSSEYNYLRDYRDCTVKFFLRFGVNPNFKIPALNAPVDASPGQRPGCSHPSPIVRPEGAQGPTALSGRSQIWRAQCPGRCPRAGILRAVGATISKDFNRKFSKRKILARY